MSTSKFAWDLSPCATFVITVCTVSGPDPGKRCQFPFKVGKKVYNDCKELEGGKSICATTTKKNGKLERKKWGYCGRCSEGTLIAT